MSATTTSDTPANALKHALRVRRPKGAAHKHPVNQLHHDEATFGERLADRISAGIGSWPFLIVQSIAVAIWLVGNAQRRHSRARRKQGPDPGDQVVAAIGLGNQGIVGMGLRNTIAGKS